MPTTRSQAQKKLLSEMKPAKVTLGQEVRSRKPLNKTGRPSSSGEPVRHWTNDGTTQANKSIRQDYDNDDDDDDELNARLGTSADLMSDDDLKDGEHYSIDDVYDTRSTRDARPSAGNKLDTSEYKDLSFGRSESDVLNMRRPKQPNTYSVSSCKRNTQNHESTENKAGKFSLAHGSILLILACLVSIFAYSFYTTSASKADTGADLSQGIQALKMSFPSQEDQLWDMVEATVDNHLEQGLNPDGPIVFLFGSDEEASDTLKCLARKLENFLSKALQEKIQDVTEIDGKNYEKQDADDTKLLLDNGLKDAFNKGQKAAVIFNLDALPPCSVLLFHSYCENESARFKNVALIFTVTLRSVSSQQADVTRSKPLNLKNDEARLISQHLSQAWVGKCRFLREEKVEALLSRVANNVGVIRKEKMLPC